MDRLQEYQALLDTLEDTPPVLEDTVRRARARNQKRRLGRFCGIPIAGLAGAAAAFVLLVNVSVPFARACGNVPFLKDLAVAAAFSPSLKAAVENDYVQPMGQKQTVNGVTMTVEYVIVDKKQVNVFYTLKSEEFPMLRGDPEIRGIGGAELSPYSAYWGAPEEGTDLQCVVLDFIDGETPGELTLNMKVRGGQGYAGNAPVPVTSEEPEEQPYTAEFSFDLRFDPAFTEAGVYYPLDQAIELDGQTVTVTGVQVYPTHLRLDLADDEGNSAWLKSLDFYLEDEDGNRYEKISNGISATGSTGSPFYSSHRLESSYFGDAEHLTVHITGAVWLDKGKEYASVDLVSGTAEGLPQGVLLGNAERFGTGARITLFSPHGGEGDRLPMQSTTYSVSDWTYRDPEGGEHRFDHLSTNGGFKVDGEYVSVDGVPDGYFTEEFFLPDYPWDTVELGVVFSRYSVFETPVEVEVK